MGSDTHNYNCDKRWRKKMDGIIFDVDGTLWDSTESVTESWNLAIKEGSELNQTLEVESLKGLFGKTMEEIYLALFPDLDEKERKRLGDLCFEYENNYLAQHPGILYEGVVETLEALSQKTKLYIVSNCQCGYIEVLLSSCHLESYFQDTLCYGQTGTSKGQTIRTLMERNSLKDVVYIGDTQGDANACKEAGIPFIFASYGFGSVPDAEVKIEQITQLLDLF